MTQPTPNPLHAHAVDILARYLNERNGHTDPHSTDIDTIISDIIGGRDPMEVFHALVFLYTHKLQE